MLSDTYQRVSGKTNTFSGCTLIRCNCPKELHCSCHLKRSRSILDQFQKLKAVSQLQTKLWKNRAQVEKYISCPLRKLITSANSVHCKLSKEINIYP